METYGSHFPTRLVPDTQLQSGTDLCSPAVGPWADLCPSVCRDGSYGWDSGLGSVMHCTRALARIAQNSNHNPPPLPLCPVSPHSAGCYTGPRSPALVRVCKHVCVCPYVCVRMCASVHVLKCFREQAAQECRGWTGRGLCLGVPPQGCVEAGGAEAAGRAYGPGSVWGMLFLTYFISCFNTCECPEIKNCEVPMRVNRIAGIETIFLSWKQGCSPSHVTASFPVCPSWSSPDSPSSVSPASGGGDSDEGLSLAAPLRSAQIPGSLGLLAVWFPERLLRTSGGAAPGARDLVLPKSGGKGWQQRPSCFRIGFLDQHHPWRSPEDRYSPQRFQRQHWSSSWLLVSQALLCALAIGIQTLAPAQMGRT